MQAKWKITLEAAMAEALLAADLYNQSGRARRLEGFFVHMHIGWIYAFQALYQRDRKGYHYQLSNGRYERVDGEKKTWDLKTFTRHQWPADNPVRQNLEFTVAVRHRLEHRFAEATAIATAGHAQALLLNFEEFVTTQFGSEHSMADELRFPVFIGSLTRDGAAKMMAAQATLPRQTRRFITDFTSKLDEAVKKDQRFEFRVTLLPKLASGGNADLAVTYVREDDLTPRERENLGDATNKATVIVREQQRDVSNADKMKPKLAARLIEDQIPFKFNASTHLARAWKALGVRPKPGVKHPERTKKDFCLYDKAHGDYVYTEAFVRKVAKKVKTDRGFEELLGLKPVRKVTSIKGRSRSKETG